MSKPIQKIRLRTVVKLMLSMAFATQIYAQSNGDEQKVDQSK